jgi:N-acetylglucosamine-6-phosphate deacetylase
VRRWNAIAPIKVLTLAPEIPGHLQLIAQLSALGIRVPAIAPAATKTASPRWKRTGRLHPPVQRHDRLQPPRARHRRRGTGARRVRRTDPDLQHVQPGARAAMRAIPRLYAVTDATAATGMPDGEYMLGSQRVMKCMGCVRLVLGDSLAGAR